MQLDGVAIILTAGAEDAAFDKAVENIVLPALADHPRLMVERRTTAEFDDAAMGAPAILRLLLDTDVLIADVDGADPALVYALGFRDGLTSGVTIPVSMGPADDWPAPPGAAPVDLTAPGAGEALRARLKLFADTGAAPPPLKTGRALQAQYRIASPAAEPATTAWTVRNEAGEALSATVGIKQGDLRKVDDVDIWVNSENIFMEMAGVYDRSISGLIRFLGANWRNSYLESDDALRRELAEQMGARQSVDIGKVLFTRVSRTTELARKHKVKLVAHVATVSPAQRGLGGGGWSATEGLRKCVFSTLEAIDERNRGPLQFGPRLTSVLIPLFGTGTGGADTRVASQILINAALDYLRQTPDSTLRQVWFLARTDVDSAACSRVLDQDPNTGPAARPSAEPAADHAAE